MKTDELIDLLALTPAPLPRQRLSLRLGLALLAGSGLGFLLLLGGYGLRPDLAAMASTPLFWAKVALPASLLGGSLAMTARLARPGVAPGASLLAVLLPVVLVWAAGLALLLGAPPAARLPLLLGETWRSCPWNIALLSAPALLAVLLALRGLAPTRPTWAGAAGGLLAGATGALVYSLHCPEMSAAFWGVWYILGMLVPTAVGALVGGRLLRW